MSARSKLFQFSLGFTTSTLAYIMLYDEIKSARHKNLRALTALAKDLEGELTIRSEVPHEESLLEHITESYKTRWLNSVTSILN